MEAEDMLEFGEESPLMDALLSEETNGNPFTSAASSLHRTAPDRSVHDHFNRSRYQTTSFSEPGVIVDDAKRIEFSEEAVAFPNEHGSYFAAFDTVQTVRSDHISAESNSFDASLGFGEIGTRPIDDLSSTPKSPLHCSVKSEMRSQDSAPQLSYEGAQSEMVETHFDPGVSTAELSVDETVDATCPVLVNERQQTDYAQEEMTTELVDDSSQPCTSSCDGRWTGANPLRRFSVLVGNKKLTFKVIDAPLHAHSHEDELINEFNVNGERKWECGMRNKCFVCGRTFATNNALREHQATHPGAKPQICSFCGRIFFHKQSLIMHERMHTGEKPFQCPICTKCFARQTNYNIHMKLHASGRRYFCSFCGKWFRLEQEMLEHQQQCVAQMNGVSVQTDRPLRYQCSYCEKMFHHRRDKNIHERTHTGERPYSCGYCGKGFTQSQALTIHIRTHTGERPYTCTICAKDFRDSSALRKHEFIKHTNMRPPYAGVSDVVMMSLPPLLTPEQFHPGSPSYH